MTAEKLDLASERQQVLVNELGCQTLASVSLGILDVLVHLPLSLEPLRAALIGTGEWTLSTVVHQVELENLRTREAC